MVAQRPLFRIAAARSIESRLAKKVFTHIASRKKNVPGYEKSVERLTQNPTMLRLFEKTQFLVLHKQFSERPNWLVAQAVGTARQLVGRLRNLRWHDR
ncbi:MAG: hypothetical protein HY537_02645 [Deltaproteobacteria bacterium]|nr:hypothetical protein [Deltaproteobacteria bacterium]